MKKATYYSANKEVMDMPDFALVSFYDDQQPLKKGKGKIVALDKYRNCVIRNNR